MVFEADFRIFMVVSWPYETICTADCGHGKRDTEKVVQQYNFATKKEADFCGIELVL
jgi:hypothetical protein